MVPAKASGFRKLLGQCLCCLLISTLLVSGCAATGSRVKVPESVKAADRERCEEFAKSEADALKSPRDSAIATAFGYSLLAGGSAGAAFVLLGIPYIIKRVNEHSKAEAEIYDQAIQICLDPVAVETKLGPDHPDVAVSLNALAARYREAEKFSEAEEIYLRSISIQEKAFGPEHHELAKTLEDYAALLAKAGRQSEAEALARRYRSIRDKVRERHHGQGQEDAATTPEGPRRSLAADGGESL